MSHNHNTTVQTIAEAVLYSGGIPENKLFSKKVVILVQGDNVGYSGSQYK